MDENERPRDDAVRVTPAAAGPVNTIERVADTERPGKGPTTVQDPPGRQDPAMQAPRAPVDAGDAPRARSPIPPLDERFHIVQHPSRRDYEYRGPGGGVAFTERWMSLQTHSEAEAVVKGMVDRALERGWSTIRVRGTTEFQRQAWIAAQARGVKALGYTPTLADQKATQLEAERLQRDRAQRDRAEPARGATISREAGSASVDRTRAPGEPQRLSPVHAALEKALREAQVPLDRHAGIRQAFDRELARRAEQGITTPVRVFDPAASRAAPAAAPAATRKRAEPERSR